jgi:uncharacterized HhH-GPD family protein
MAEPTHLWFTDDPGACALLATDPFALLVGFALDQQVTVQKAFAGPQAIRERIGSLDPRVLAETDLVEAFSRPPAVHRFPGSMATRVQDLARHVVEDYDGDASLIWRDAKDAADLRRRIGGLPGFGEMKIKSLGAVLSKRYGLEVADGLVPGHPTLGDVDSPEALTAYQAAKKAHKREWAAQKA